MKSHLDPHGNDADDISIVSIDSDVMVRVCRYVELVSRHSRTESDNDEIEEILWEAQSNSTLEFWLAEFDHIISHQVGVLDETAREFYKDQHALLTEYTALKDADCSITKEAKDNFLVMLDTVRNRDTVSNRVPVVITD